MPGQHRQLPSESHRGDLGTTAGTDSVEEGAERSWRAGDGPGCLDEHAASVGPADFGDTQSGPCRLTAGLTNSWIQAEITDQALRRGESPDVPDRGHQRQGDCEVDSGYRHQAANVVAVRRRPGTGRVCHCQFLAAVQEKIHAAQITLAEAEALAEFADDATAMNRLLRDVGSYNFKFTVEQQRRAREKAATIAQAKRDF